MPNLFVVRKAPRKGLFLRRVGNENLMFVLSRKTDRSELDELVRAQLAQQGIVKDAAVEALVEKAEKEYEDRVKAREAHKEAKRLMNIRSSGGKIMSVGFRKWRQVYHPAVKQFNPSQREGGDSGSLSTATPK